MEQLLICLFLILGATTVSSQPNCPTRPVVQPIPDLSNNSIIQQALAKIDNLLSSAVSSFPLPGLVATIVYDQEQIWSKTYGKRNFFDPNSPPPSSDDLVRVASITKVFTDIMLFQARDKGLVHLDDAVSSLLPEFQPRIPYKTRKSITLRQVASHSAGLERETPCDLSCTQAEVLTNAKKRWAILPTFTKPHYSNFGTALLGRALEVAVKQSYEDYVTQHILQPLKMSATYTINSSTLARMAVGVDYSPKGWVPADVYPLNWQTPDGGLLASANDIAKLISFLFRRNAPAGGSQVLDGATIAELLTPVLLTHDGVGGFGYPFEFNYTAGYWTLSKAGELPGYRSNVAIVPELKIGVFVSALLSTTPDDSTLTIPMLDILIPAFEQVLFSMDPPSPLPSNSDVFLGTYLSDDGFATFVITLGSGKTTTNTRNNIRNNIRDNTNDKGDGTPRAQKPVKQLFANVYNTIDGSFAYTAALGVVDFDHTTLRISMTDPLPECRWLDDGYDQELIYFDTDGKSPAKGFFFMEEQYTRKN